MGKQARKHGRPLRLTDLWSRQRPNSSSLSHSALNTSVVRPRSNSNLVDSIPPQLLSLSAHPATEPPVLSFNASSNDVLPACSLLFSSVDSSNKLSTYRPEGGPTTLPSGIPTSPSAPMAPLEPTPLAYTNRVVTRPYPPSPPTPTPTSPARPPIRMEVPMEPPRAAARQALSDVDRADHSPPLCPALPLGPTPNSRTVRADPTSPLPPPPSGRSQRFNLRTRTLHPYQGCHKGSSPLRPPAHPDPSLQSPRKRSLVLHDFWCPDRPFMARNRPILPCPCPIEMTPGRRRLREPIEEGCPQKIPRVSPPDSPRPASTSPLARPSLSSSPSQGPPLAGVSSPEDVQFLGPPGPPVLQAVSPSGDVRLTLRRYSPTDRLSSPTVLVRMELRIQPRDLYAIPSDGHCGYHSLAVLSHPHFPSPPSPPERQELHTALLQRLLLLPHPSLRAAASAGLHYPPPRHLPQQHWLNSTWLHQIPDLPPIGCLAPLGDRDSPWYYCTALTCSPSQLEHSLEDLLRVADSGRLLLHSLAHYHPVSPPAFLSLAIRQCSALLQRQLGGDDLPPVPPRLPVITPPPLPRSGATRLSGHTPAASNWDSVPPPSPRRLSGGSSP